MGILDATKRAELRKIWTPKLETWRHHLKVLSTSVLIAYLTIDALIDKMNLEVFDEDLDEQLQIDVFHAAGVAVADELDYRIPIPGAIRLK